MTDTPTSLPAAPQPRRIPRRTLAIGAIALPLALGAAGLSLAQPAQVAMTPLNPTTVTALAPSAAVAVKGQVSEIFGNKFVIEDGTGRALVETGRQGEDGALVAKGDAVTVQGRFDKGFLHAKLITRADGSEIRLGKDGPRPGLDWAKERVGLGPGPDVAALTKAVEGAGYTDIRVLGRGPKHLDVAAKGGDGRERELHVGFNGDIREKRVF